MLLPVTITRVSEVSIPQSGGGSKSLLRIEWKAGDHGPFVETFDKETFEPNAVNAALAALGIKLEQVGAK